MNNMVNVFYVYFETVSTYLLRKQAAAVEGWKSQGRSRGKKRGPEDLEEDGMGGGDKRRKKRVRWGGRGETEILLVTQR